MFKKIIFLGVIAFVISCTKESTSTIQTNEPNPEISVIPAIVLEDVSTTQVKAHQDSITFSISYIDGDGNLGTTDPDVESIELVDTRDSENLVFGYHLQPLAPEGSTITISGTLDIVLKNTILLDENNDQEETTFKIRLKDMAGNWSNEVESGTIIITK